MAFDDTDGKLTRDTTSANVELRVRPSGGTVRRCPEDDILMMTRMGPFFLGLVFDRDAMLREILERCKRVGSGEERRRKKEKKAGGEALFRGQKQRFSLI